MKITVLIHKNISAIQGDFFYIFCHAGDFKQGIGDRCAVRWSHDGYARPKNDAMDFIKCITKKKYEQKTDRKYFQIFFCFVAFGHE